MNAVFDLLCGPASQQLAMALLHTLWQGLALVALLWLVLRRLPADRPQARYWCAFAALLAVVACGLLTWSVLDFGRSPVAASCETAANRLGSEAISPADLRPGAAGRPISSIGVLNDNGGATHGAALTVLRPSADASRPRPAWFSFIVAVWVLGVVLMVVRMVWTVARLRRFARGPEVTDSRLRLWIDELRQALHLSRPLRIVETAGPFGPAVFGVLQPVLALPVSLLSGLPPDVVRAILAHELAHICRHDYLFNLVQMVVEALLFFNPAVWWISRQVRIEREACCDAMAAHVLGQPLVLAEALAAWAERVAGPHTAAAALAWRGRSGPRLLLDRVRRMAVPGYRPPVPVSPWGLLGFMLTGMVVLGLLSCGTSWVVALAAKALTPAERMEQIVETQKEYASAAPPAEGEVHLSGTVRTSDGKPLPKDMHATVLSYRPKSGTSKAFMFSAPSFSVTAPSGKLWLCAELEGYAPAVVGPLAGKAGEDISGIEMVFDHGVPQEIRVVDEKGEPVAGAKVVGVLMLDGFWAGGASHTTSAQGTLIMPIVSDSKFLYAFSITKPGFQPLTQSEVALKPDQPLTLTLLHSKPVRGVVVSAQGEPVVGAEIRQFAKLRPQGSELSGQHGPVLAVTDASGRFVLDELDDEAAYALLIVAKGQGWHLVRDVTTKQTDLQIELGPELIVSGTLRGDVSQLTKQRKPAIAWSQNVSFPSHHSETVNSGIVPIKATNEGGKFTIRSLLPGEVTITAANHVAHAIVGPSQPHQQVTIDLTQPVPQPKKRQIVMRFVTPDGKVPPEGAIEVHSLQKPDDQGRRGKTVRLEKGEARFDAYAPASPMYSPKGLLGYWFAEVTTEIQSGEEPLEISVPVIAAGAIAGEIVHADGTPASKQVSVRVEGRIETQAVTRFGSFGAEVNTDDTGRFFISPLPLRGTFTVIACWAYTAQFSQPVELDAAHPTAQLTLKLPRTTSVEGTVVDDRRRPLSHTPVDLEFRDGTLEHNQGWSGKFTDQQGHFRFDGLAADYGRYSVIANPRRDFRPLRRTLPLDGKPVKLQLQRGLVIEGKVVDRATGWPVPGAEVFARPPEYRPDNFICQAESLTDDEGCFRFSNLDDQPYSINILAGGQGPVYKPGEKSVILRVTLPQGSTLRPQPPAEPPSKPSPTPESSKPSPANEGDQADAKAAEDGTMSLAEAVAAINRHAAKWPESRVQKPLTEDEVIQAIQRLASDWRFLSAADYGPLQQVVKTRRLPRTVLLRQFVRYNDGAGVEHGWWVRLYVLREDLPPFVLTIREQSLFRRPYTQKERLYEEEIRGSKSMGTIDGLVAYFDEDPKPSEVQHFSAPQADRLAAAVKKAIDDHSAEKLLKTYQWDKVSAEMRAEVQAEAERLVKRRLASVSLSPRRFGGRLVHWRGFKIYDPNLPVLGYVVLEFADTEGPKSVSLEFGETPDGMRLVNYIVSRDDGPKVIGKRLPPIHTQGYPMVPLKDGSYELYIQIETTDDLPALQSANLELRKVELRRRAETPPKETTAPPAAKKSEAPTQDGGPCIARLPSGVAVELVAVAEHPSKGKSWWRPNGLPIAETLYDYLNISVKAGKDQRVREFVVQLSPTPREPIGTNWRIDPAVTWSGDTTPTLKSRSIADLRVMAASVPTDRKQVTVALGFADDPWNTLGETVGRESLYGNGPGEHFSFSPPLEKGGSTVVTVAHALAGVETRVMAIGTDGKEHSADQSSAGGGGNLWQVTATFNKPLKDIKHFRLQTRPYRWVEFRNVSLESGQKTDVQVVVPAENAPAATKPPPAVAPPAEQPAAEAATRGGPPPQ